MEKRTERNKDLYIKVNQEILEYQQKVENNSFTMSSNTLSSINPDLFGNDNSKAKKRKKRIFKLFD